MNRFEWAEAATVEEALGALGPGAALKAGGVDLLDLMKERIVAPARLVNIRNVAGLEGIEVQNASGGAQIGALTTLAKIAADPRLRSGYTALAEAAEHAATPQIRNMATAGGNVLQRPRCWYFRSEAFTCRKKGGMACLAQDGDNRFHAIFGNEVCAIVHPSALATALVALGGRVELRSARGREEVALEEFFVAPEKDVTRENRIAPDEILTFIRVPVPHPNSRSAFLKQGEKESFDWPIAEVAVALEREGPGADAKVKRASVVLGAAAPVPWRARKAEAALAGRVPDEAAARAAADAALEGATPLSGNRYKLAVFDALVRRAILRAAGGGS